VTSQDCDEEIRFARKLISPYSFGGFGGVIAKEYSQHQKFTAKHMLLECYTDSKTIVLHAISRIT